MSGESTDSTAAGKGSRGKRRPSQWRAERVLTMDESQLAEEGMNFDHAQVASLRIIGKGGVSPEDCKKQMADAGVEGEWEFVRFDHTDSATKRTVWGKPRRGVKTPAAKPA